jgi:hypothetical protein
MIDLNKIPEVLALSEIFRRHDITLRTYQLDDNLEGRKIRSFHCEFAQADDRKQSKLEKAFQTVSVWAAAAQGSVQDLMGISDEGKFDVSFATDKERAEFLTYLGRDIVRMEDTPTLAKYGRSGFRIGR